MYEIHETLSPSYWQTSARATSPDRLDDATRRTCEPSRLLNRVTFHHYSDRRFPQLAQCVQCVKCIHFNLFSRDTKLLLSLLHSHPVSKYLKSTGIRSFPSEYCMAEGYKLLSVSNPYQNSFQNEFLDREEMSEWSFRNRFLRGYQEDDATENKEDDGEDSEISVFHENTVSRVFLNDISEDTLFNFQHLS
ncbi:hypothetical protein WN51_11433 [Melipona quadrifasciata]|uniref:Uncharacterized protein n=1 Tax=Melipona quadrifasciata TaxID=166423 RepID=A0A0N0BK14_9HYME|nr:hypothetical protein WN51_11433 [Melipona quadrifasciata]